MSEILHFNLIFKPEPEGGFTVIVPSLPGCVTYGRNLKKAKEMARDAILGYLESLLKHKELIPSDADNFVATLDVSAKKSAKKLTYA